MTHIRSWTRILLSLSLSLEISDQENVFASCATGHHHQLRCAPAMAAVHRPLGPQSPHLSLRIHLPSHSKSPLFPPKLRRSHSPRLPRNPNHPPSLLTVLPLHLRRLGVLNSIARRAIDRRGLRDWSENNWGVSGCDDFGGSFLVTCLVEAVCFCDNWRCHRALSWRS